jgi:multiple sugar transport system substrate-binding protein
MRSTSSPTTRLTGRGNVVRRRALAGTAIVLAAVTLAACAGQGSGGGDEGDPDADVTLDFWNPLNGPDKPAVDQVIKDFNASQDKITVKNNAQPSDVMYQKLLTAVSSDDGPDLVAIHAGRIPAFADKGALQPVDAFYTDHAEEGDAIIPNLVSASEFEDANYGVPLNQATVLMYWNKEMFRAAGLDPEAPPTTWDEFAAMVPKLSVDENGDGKPEQYAIALSDHEGIPVWQPFIWNNGGDVVSEDGKTSMLDDPKSLEAIQFWTDLVVDQKASPIGLGGADADKLFQTGKAAIEIVGPWMTTAFDEAGLDYGIGKPFAGPADDTILADVVSFTVPSTADEATRDAAFEFMAYWNSVEGQTTWADGSGFPPTRTDLSGQTLGDNPYPAIFGAPDVIENTRVLMPGVVANPTINDTIFAPALQRVLNGDGTVEEVFTKASQEVQDALDESAE